jgi:hypothetical protein
MRLFVIAVAVACCLFVILRYIVSPADVSELSSLVNLRTESAPDESRLRFHGRIGSGFKYVQSLTSTVEGTAIVVTIKSNLPILAGWNVSSSFDQTLEIPANVTEVRVGETREVMWSRGDCPKRFMRHDGWHCEGNL